MGLSDLSRVINEFKEAGFSITADVSYIMVLVGFTMIVAMGFGLAAFLAYRGIKGLLNATPIGVVKALVVMAIAFFLLGLIIP